MWVTWLQAKKFSCKPSELLGIESQPQAFYFNRAVFTFGTALEAELERAGQTRGKKKKNEQQIAMARQRVMTRWGIVEQKFADPLSVRG